MNSPAAILLVSSRRSFSTSSYGLRDDSTPGSAFVLFAFLSTKPFHPIPRRGRHDLKDLAERESAVAYWEKRMDDDERGVLERKGASRCTIGEDDDRVSAVELRMDEEKIVQVVRNEMNVVTHRWSPTICTIRVGKPTDRL